MEPVWRCDLGPGCQRSSRGLNVLSAGGTPSRPSALSAADKPNLRGQHLSPPPRPGPPLDLWAVTRPSKQLSKTPPPANVPQRRVYHEDKRQRRGSQSNSIGSLDCSSLYASQVISSI